MLTVGELIFTPSPQVEDCVLNIGKFNGMVSLAAFFPFKSAQAALDNINAISEGELVALFRLLNCNPSSDVMMLYKNLSIL